MGFPGMEPTSSRAHEEGSRIKVALVNDYDLVVRGLHQMLAEHPDDVEIVRPEADEADVVLFDTFGSGGMAARIPELTRNPRFKKVVAFSWNHSEEAVHVALSMGAAGYLSKGLGPQVLVTALRRVHAGEKVVLVRGAGGGSAAGLWPGQATGLTVREAETLALIVRGMSNREIADDLFLSENSVKTHIRHAYRKIGVTRRSQAVRWGYENGFAPHRQDVG